MRTRSISLRPVVLLVAAVAAVAAAAIVPAGCASRAPAKSPASGSARAGFRMIEAVVVERAYEPSGGYMGGGTYTLGFEARDGEVTAHYSFPVTRAQYNRYSEGSHVQLVLADDQLRDIRPVP